MDPGYQYAPVTEWEKLLDQLEMIAFQRTSGDARVEFLEEGPEGVERKPERGAYSNVNVTSDRGEVQPSEADILD